MRKNMSKALAVSLSIALAAGNTPIGTRYVSAQENPAVWEAQTTAEGEAVTSGRSVEEDTGTNVGGETEETTEVSSEKKEDTSGTVTTENKTEDLQGATTEGKSETSTTEGAEEASTETQPEETEQPEEEPVVSFTQGEDTTNYRNFKEAWETASVTGGTLTLCQNVEASELLEASSDITLNLNGYELSGSIEVTAGTLYVTDTSENGGGLLFNPSGTAVAVTGGALDITNAQITGKDSAINVYNGTVNIDKDTVISAKGNAVNLITPYSKNNEEDNSVDINSMDSNSMDLTVSGGSITSTEGAAVREYLDTSESQDGEEIIWHTNISNITIKDGTFSGKGKALDFSDSLVKEESVLNITGGTFSSDIKEYLSSAYTTNKTEDGQYIVSERENPVKEDLKYNLEDVTYDGKTHPVKVSSEKALGAIKVLYNGKEEMPVNAGTYEVSVEIAESNNYYSGQFDLGSFQITKAETSVNLTVALTNEREHVEENTIGYFGDEVTMTASVDGVEGETLEGSVAFYDGETELKTVPLENNSAQFKTSELTAQTHEITAKYIPAEEANYKGSASEKVAANIAEVKETGIEVTTQPAKTTYTDSETFNPEGMIVTAHYNNGSTKEVEDYTVDTTTKLTVDTTEIQITHADNYTASVPVKVGHDTNYRYEKNEARNTLTKKCGGCDEIFGTMSIAAPESMELDRENGNPAVLTVTGDISASEVSITYASLTGADISPLAPTKAGTYTATATYNNQTVTVMFTLIISVTGVTANEVYALKVGDSANLSKKIAPEDATNQDVIWKSDNENIVTVDDNGKITAVAEGEANITVTTKDQNKTATCKIYAMPQNAKFGKCGDNAWWKFNDGVFTVWGNGAVTDTKDFASYKTKTTSIVVEKGITEIGGFSGFTILTDISFSESIKSIKSSAFQDCEKLEKIDLTKGMEEIGDWAFAGCVKLSNITLGENITKIGYNAFAGCSGLKKVMMNARLENEQQAFWKAGTEGIDVVYGKGITKIGSLFTKSTVRSVEIPEGVKTIGDSAFTDCEKLEKVELPESMEQVGQYAFEGCRGVSHLKIKSPNCIYDQTFGSFPGLGEKVDNLTVEFGEKVTEIPRLIRMGGNVKHVKFDGEVEKIGDSVFDGWSNIEEIEIPESVKEIGDWAFAGCVKLNNITLGENITKIGYNAFAGCSGLKKVMMNARLENEQQAFWKAGTEGIDVVYGKGITKIGSLFTKSTVRSVEIPEGVKTIGDSAFTDCEKLERIELPESMEQVGQYAFKGCRGVSHLKIKSPNCIYDQSFGSFPGLGEKADNLTVEFGEKVTEIPRLIRMGGNVKHVKFDGEVEKIGDSVFDGWSNIEEIEIPESVKEIGDWAFAGCVKLGNITLGENITKIGYNAFGGCSGLKKVMMNARLENEKRTFENAGSEGMDVIYGKGITKIGSLFTKSTVRSIEIPEGVKTIEDSAFEDCEKLERIELPESMEQVGQYAFKGCRGVSHLKIKSPNCIYDQSFGSFPGLGEKADNLTVEFGEKVTEIPRLIRMGGNVKHVKFDGEVEKIGDSVFDGWSNIEEIEIPESVKEIGDWAFVGCVKLSNITLGPNITTVGYGAFYGLTNLTTVTLPSKLKDIAGNAFANCKNLKEYIVSDENKDLSAKDGVLYGKDETELISYPAGKDDQTEFDMLSMNVDTIREGAFDGNTALKSVKIGDDVQTIGEEAFANVSDALTLHVYKNSYADEYAKENEVPVEYLSEEVEEGTPVFRGASLSLAGTILINYYIEFPEDVKDGRVEFDLVDDSGKTKSKVTATLKDASKETITSGGKQYEYYKYSVSLTAKQMADKVLAKAYATTADGKEVATRKFYYSVEKYVSNKMKNTATKDSLKNVLASMVNYGAAAQNYFAYNTQHLADKLLYDTTIVTDENKKKLDSTLEGYQKTKEQMQQYIRTITEVENPKTRIAGIALDLKSTVSIRVIVPKDTTSADNKIAYTVGDGTAVKYLKLQNYDATYYYADITGIVAKNLDDMYHIYVCDASGNQISNIVNYGVMSYAIQKWESENEDLVNLVKKLQVYNVAAQKYFESK